MDAIFEQAVRERAYALWLEDGMVHGMDRAHWITAATAIKRLIANAAAPRAPEPVAAKTGSTKTGSIKTGSFKTGTAKKGAKVAAKAAGKPPSAGKAPAPAHLAN